MSQHDVAALLADFAVAKPIQRRGSNAPPKRRAAASCGFNWNQFVLHVMQLHDLRPNRLVLKVDGYGLHHVFTKLFPRLGLGEDCVTKRAGIIAPVLRIANLENYFHPNSLLR